MSRLILPEPQPELKQLSTVLSQKIHSEIDEAGFISFSRYMEMALYEPGLGYYSAGLHKFGESGDFVTAPELGSLFAACLARQVEEIAAQLGDYDILELGAGTGKFAIDLLRHLPAASQPRHYFILERSADLQAVQKQLIAQQAPQLLERIKWLSKPPHKPWDGIVLGNEVLDALSVERFRLGEDGIEQAGVCRHGQAFAWCYRPAPAQLQQAVEQLRLSSAENYTSEINTQLALWLEAVTASLHKGAALFIDYGYPRSEYYLPERSEGTLMCHFRHRAHGDVFFWPGLQDITAFVDFTALAEAADASALEVTGYTSQTQFLLGCGLDKILAQRVAESTDGGVDLFSEARQLTLPGSMGERFQVMALTRGLNADWCGFGLRDLRHRL